MVKVDLITGFLGAGKTTFIQKYIKYLKAKGEQIHIIENEFAETRIDADLLKEDEGTCCEISDLSGMCMCCIGKKEFIRLLIDSAGKGCDRILVEPSGIYDVDEFFDVMSDARVSGLCEIGTIITIMDPLSYEKLTEEVKYLMFSQILASGTVIYSKTQLVDMEQLEAAVEWLNQLLIEKGCQAGICGELSVKDWSLFSEDDFEEFENAGYFRMVHERESFEHSQLFRSREYVINNCRDEEDVKNQVKLLFENKAFKQIFRVKGFIKTLDGQNYQINCTGQLLSIEKTSLNQSGVVIIGC